MDFTAHMDWLFRQAMALTHHTHDAQELTQDTLLSALASAVKPENERAFLLTVLRRRHADMLRRKYRLPTVSIDCIAELADESIPDGDDAAQVRRAVAFLADKYREAIVRHYLRGERVADIADDLTLPKGTVLSRLSAGREQIRKGWNSMEDYGRQSYQPDRLDVSCHGRPGLHDEPWSLVADDLMKQNILIAAYEEPVTPVEIARHLGIPAAYVETAVEALIRGGLMQRVGGSKVFTDFIITTPEQRERGLDYQIDLVRGHYDDLMAPVKVMVEAICAAECYPRLRPDEQRKLREYFTIHLLSTAIYTATRNIIPAEETFPDRCDGGNWIASGYRWPMDHDWSCDRFHLYTYGGERFACWEQFMDAKSIALRVYDVQHELNRYQHGPIEMDEPVLCRLLYILHRGLTISDTGIDPALMQNIPHLMECRVLRDADGKPECAVPVLTKAEYAALDAVRVEQMHVLIDFLEPLLRGIFPLLRVPLPSHLNGRVAEFRRYNCYAIPMALREECIRRGEWPAENGGGSPAGGPAMVLVVEPLLQL